MAKKIVSRETFTIDADNIIYDNIAMGVTTGRYYSELRKLQNLRQAWQDAKEEFDKNLIAQSGIQQTAKVQKLQDMFERDCKLWANSQLPTSRFRIKWGGHFRAGLINKSCYVTLLNEPEPVTGYVQY